MADNPQYPDKDPDLDADFLRMVREMSDEAEASKKEGRQLGLGLSDDEGASDTPPDLSAADLQNPDLSHRLYYAVRKLLIDHLPPGKENEDLRRYVYDERNLYINRGKDLDERGIRGSDGRMGYIPHLKQALKTVKEWVARGGSSFDIFEAFWTMNERLGYHKKREGQAETGKRDPSTLFSTLGSGESDPDTTGTPAPGSPDADEEFDAA